MDCQPGGQRSSSDLIIAAADADSAVRVAASRDILRRLSQNDLSVTELVCISSFALAPNNADNNSGISH